MSDEAKKVPFQRAPDPSLKKKFRDEAKQSAPASYDNTCFVCGKVIPPGPDFCSTACQEKAWLEDARKQSAPATGEPDWDAIKKHEVAIQNAPAPATPVPTVCVSCGGTKDKPQARLAGCSDDLCWSAFHAPATSAPSTLITAHAIKEKS